ncbi:uncharacterized protein I206_104386 [Kwoniella pini CBS 10737]|uniref:Thioredoxin domain-containing protein n=1 Tax=Kwoniella pini CBS 10737 TaxID=1296096 RepID=A0A1B9I1U9_9TREE|nr:uncharacterized protein I206_04033 [Kwoniella pini CBS 10737]OCF49512.1 hypothetical protein I206_04033 [Kwoniella pini CBS 10737]
MTSSEMHDSSLISKPNSQTYSTTTSLSVISSRSSSDSSPSTITSNSPKKDRRLSRKLPPALTESLENLAASSSYSQTHSNYPFTGVFSKLNQLETTLEYKKQETEIIGDISPLSKTISLPVPEDSTGFRDSSNNHNDILNVTPTLNTKIFRTIRSSSESQATSIPTNNIATHSIILPKGKYKSINIKSNSISGPIIHPSSSSSCSYSSSTNTPTTLSTSNSMGFLKSSSKSSSSRSDILLTPKQSLGKLNRNSIESSSGSGNSCRRESCGTWSLFDEIQFEDSLSSSSKIGSKLKNQKPKKESSKEKKERIRIEKELFDEYNSPTHKSLFEASLMEVIDENGRRFKFGDLVRNRKTIVIFIRHWYCPLCAQYMNSILAEVSLDALEEANVDLIIIGNGSDKMLNGYRNKAFRSPFKIYTDPTLALYRALGLTRQTGDGGENEDKGEYLVQSAKESTIQTIKRATKMPIRNPGHFTQLGGEFIFNGTLNVTYTHRMINTRSHQPIRDICEKAGVRLEFIHYEPGLPPPPVHRHSFFGIDPTKSQQELKDDGMIVSSQIDNWQKERNETLERMKALKAARRGCPNTLNDSRLKVVDNVRIVGQDMEEDEIVMGFSSLGFAA